MAIRTQRVQRGLETQLELKPTTSEWLKEGYHFLGWNSNPNATTPTYLDGAWGTFQADNTTLHAIWQQDYTIVGAFGFSTYINGYSSDKQCAVQRISNYDIEWADIDTNKISVTDVGYAPGGKFIRTVYSSTNSAKPEYSTDGITWTKSNKKLAKQALCCGGVYDGSPRYIVVCDPTTSGPNGVPGSYVGPWWSNDAITWTRSKFLNSFGNIQDYESTDKMEDCYYGRISVSGEEKDVFLVQHTCGGGKLDMSLDGGVIFKNILDRSGSTNYDYNSCTILNNKIICAGSKSDDRVCFCIGTLNSDDSVSWQEDVYPTDTNNNYLPIDYGLGNYYKVRIVEGNGVYVLAADDWIYTKTADGDITTGWTKVQRLPTVTFERATTWSTDTPYEIWQTAAAHMIFTGDKFVLAIRSVDGAHNNEHPYQDPNNPVLYSTDGTNWQLSGTRTRQSDGTWIQTGTTVPTCRRLAVGAIPPTSIVTKGYFAGTRTNTISPISANAKAVIQPNYNSSSWDKTIQVPVTGGHKYRITFDDMHFCHGDAVANHQLGAEFYVYGDGVTIERELAKDNSSFNHTIKRESGYDEAMRCVYREAIGKDSENAVWPKTLIDWDSGYLSYTPDPSTVKIGDSASADGTTGVKFIVETETINDDTILMLCLRTLGSCYGSNGRHINARYVVQKIT